MSTDNRDKMGLCALSAMWGGDFSFLITVMRQNKTTPREAMKQPAGQVQGDFHGASLSFLSPSVGACIRIVKGTDAVGSGGGLCCFT